MDQTVTDARARLERTVGKEDVGKNAGVPPDSATSNDAKAIGTRPPSRSGGRFRRAGAFVIALAMTLSVWLGNRYLVSHGVEQFLSLIHI